MEFLCLVENFNVSQCLPLSHRSHLLHCLKLYSFMHDNRMSSTFQPLLITPQSHLFGGHLFFFTTLQPPVCLLLPYCFISIIAEVKVYSGQANLLYIKIPSTNIVFSHLYLLPEFFYNIGIWLECESKQQDLLIHRDPRELDYRYQSRRGVTFTLWTKWLACIHRVVGLTPAFTCYLSMCTWVRHCT